MLQDIWDGILELTAQFVIPDWGALVALLPVIVFVVIIFVLAWTVLRLRRAPPARRGKARIPPAAPAGVHMPGPSYAPIFASIGAFLLFLGLVFGGWILVLGAIALTLTLLYWLAEGLRIYDHDVGAAPPALPEPGHAGPPPGVHMPGPSFLPVLGAIGVFMLFLGLVFGGWLLAFGVIALVVTLLGWLPAARREWVRTVEADATGHLESGPAPRTPRGLFWALGLLLVFGVLLQAGLLPPSEASGGTASAAPSGEPAASGGPAPSAGGPIESGAPGAPSSADVSLAARNIAFLTSELTLPADRPFTLAFSNEDAGTPHNVELKDASNTSVFQGEVFNGVETRIYDVPALKAGVYTFLCTVHPSMTGTATAQ
jgi:plastocyanin